MFFPVQLSICSLCDIYIHVEEFKGCRTYTVRGRLERLLSTVVVVLAILEVDSQQKLDLSR